MNAPTGPSSNAAPIRSRALVVGSPRSGTTLLQVMLAAHPEVYSFPESHYFRKLWGRRWNQRRWGFTSPRAAAGTLDELGRELGLRDDELPSVPRWWPLAARWGRAFAPAVDAAARRKGAAVWVDKTPGHLQCIDQIERWVPDPRIVHVVRDGREVTASLYVLCHTHPKQWLRQFIPDANLVHGLPADSLLIPKIVTSWNDAIQITMDVAGRPGHHVVRYDALVTQPEATLDAVSAFLSIERRDEMMRFWEAADEAVGWRREKEHMRGAFEQGLRSPVERFGETFDASTRAEIEAGLLGAGDLGAVLPA